eukprot:739551-Rhodomonas_salina.1
MVCERLSAEWCVVCGVRGGACCMVCETEHCVVREAEPCVCSVLRATEHNAWCICARLKEKVRAGAAGGRDSGVLPRVLWQDCRCALSSITSLLGGGEEPSWRADRGRGRERRE